MQFWYLGESGRYPLLYEGINLTLNYIKRLQKLQNPNSLVGLAFQEQRAMNLDWYRCIEPVLKLDACYTADHVTTHNTIHHITNDLTHAENTTNEQFIIHNGIKYTLPPQKKKPIISRYFTVHSIYHHKITKSSF